MNEMVDAVAKALIKVPFDMPGAGGLRGRLELGPAQAQIMARAALVAARDYLKSTPIDTGSVITAITTAVTRG